MLRRSPPKKDASPRGLAKNNKVSSPDPRSKLEVAIGEVADPAPPALFGDADDDMEDDIDEGLVDMGVVKIGLL